MQWIIDGSKPEEKRRLLFVVGNNDMRFGKFYNEDQWGRKWMFCDGSFFSIEHVKKWAYIPDESPQSKDVKPPFPEKMTFKEMLTNLFNTDFLTPEELQTISDAGEMYGNGCIYNYKKQQNQ